MSVRAHDWESPNDEAESFEVADRDAPQFDAIVCPTADASPSDARRNETDADAPRVGNEFCLGPSTNGPFQPWRLQSSPSIPSIQAFQSDHLYR